MTRIQLEALALANGVEAAVIAALDFNALLIELQKKIREKANAVPAGIDAADHDALAAYELACAEIMTDLGIAFQVGDAADDFSAIVETVVSHTHTPSGALAPGFIEYVGKDGSKQVFELAKARNEKVRKAVAKLIHFAVKGEKVSKDGVKYSELIITAVVYDAAGNGVQGNYSVNSSLLEKLAGQGAFKGVPMTKGVPVLEEGQTIWIYCQFSENVKNVTTWGSNNPLHVQAAKDLNRAVYQDKGETFAAILHRENSLQESLDRFIGIADERTVARLKERELTSLELDGARQEQTKEIELKFKAKSIASAADNAELLDKAIKKFTALGYTVDQALKMING